MASLQGFAGVVADVDPNSRAQRSTTRPNDVQGSYRKTMKTGTIAAGLTAASRVFSFRFAPTPNTMVAVVRNVQVSIGDLAAFTAGFITLDMFVSRSFTVQDATGGVAGTISGNNGKMKTAHASSAGAGYYISTTAAISGNTDVLDTDAMSSINLSAPATAGLDLLPPFDLFKPGTTEWPLVLANNEGLVIKATVPATGTWDLAVTIAHDEFVSFQ